MCTFLWVSFSIDPSLSLSLSPAIFRFYSSFSCPGVFAYIKSICKLFHNAAARFVWLAFVSLWLYMVRESAHNFHIFILLGKGFCNYSLLRKTPSILHKLCEKFSFIFSAHNCSSFLEYLMLRTCKRESVCI